MSFALAQVVRDKVASVGGSIITIKVIQAGERAEELLAKIADAVHVQPDRRMAPEVAHFHFVDLDAVEGGDALRRALDHTGDDWEDHLLLGPVAR